MKTWLSDNRDGAIVLLALAVLYAGLIAMGGK